MTAKREPFIGPLLEATRMIPLTKNQYTLLDEDDYEEYSKDNWLAYYHPHTKSYYAKRAVRGEDGNQHYVLMHRHITGFQWEKVDHINFDTLDNRRENLRDGTLHNEKHRRPQGGTSQYHGVCWDKSKQKWVSQIQVDGKKIHLGLFDNEIVAALAYDQASHKYHGGYGTRNFS